jgi:hypothetical protein
LKVSFQRKVLFSHNLKKLQPPHRTTIPTTTNNIHHMPNTKKTYRYQEQRNRIPLEQLQLIEKSLARIRERARQIAIERQGNLQNSTPAAGDPRGPNIASGNLVKSAGVSAGTCTEPVGQQDPTTRASDLQDTGTVADRV